MHFDPAIVSMYHDFLRRSLVFHGSTTVDLNSAVSLPGVEFLVLVTFF